ncbi:unnamed protein product, partial [Brassica napus]
QGISSPKKKVDYFSRRRRCWSYFRVVVLYFSFGFREETEMEKRLRRQ